MAKTRKPRVPIKCPICDVKLKNLLARSRHMRQAHYTVREQCKFCGVPYTRKSIRRHERQCGKKSHQERTRRLSVKCEYCEEIFVTSIMRNTHVVQTHNERPEITKCVPCNRLYASKSLYQRHMKKFHRLRRNCDVCGKVFQSITSYEKHLEKGHADPPTSDLNQLRSELNKKDYLEFKKSGQHIKPSLSYVSDLVQRLGPYYLSLTETQILRVLCNKVLHEDPSHIDMEQRHKEGYGYVLEDGDKQSRYELLTSEQLESSSALYGYPWRHGSTYQIIDVYIGYTTNNRESAENAATRKWNDLVMSTNNGKETCTDRSYMDFGHFIDPSEAFLIPGMVATGCTKSVEVLKYLSRNETGSVCSKKNQTCYKILSPWIGQLRNALKEVNHYWMDAGIPGNCETIPDLSGDTILTTSYFYLAFVEEQLEKIAMREDGQGLNNVVEHLNYCLDKLNNLSISR